MLPAPNGSRHRGRRVDFPFGNAQGRPPYARHCYRRLYGLEIVAAIRTPKPELQIANRLRIVNQPFAMVAAQRTNILDGWRTIVMNHRAEFCTPIAITVRVTSVAASVFPLQKCQCRDSGAPVGYRQSCHDGLRDVCSGLAHGSKPAVATQIVRKVF